MTDAPPNIVPFQVPGPGFTLPPLGAVMSRRMDVKGAIERGAQSGMEAYLAKIAEKRMEAITAFLREELSKLIDGGEKMDDETLVEASKLAGFHVYVFTKPDEPGVEYVMISRKPAVLGEPLPERIAGMRLEIFKAPEMKAEA